MSLSLTPSGVSRNSMSAQTARRLSRGTSRRHITKKMTQIKGMAPRNATEKNAASASSSFPLELKMSGKRSDEIWSAGERYLATSPIKAPAISVCNTQKSHFDAARAKVSCDSHDADKDAKTSRIWAAALGKFVKSVDPMARMDGHKHRLSNLWAHPP